MSTTTIRKIDKEKLCITFVMAESCNSITQTFNTVHGGRKEDLGNRLWKHVFRVLIV